MKLRVGTRGSSLALAQSKLLQTQLAQQNPNLKFETKVIKTTGDEAINRPFSAIGGRGVFTRELDEALSKNEIDFAVHSLKDLTSEFIPGVMLGAVTAPADPRDVVVSRSGQPLGELSKGAVVGTASLRRTALLKSKYPHLKIEMLRGNIDTRLRKVAEGTYDAIVIAAAGLIRLGWESKITEFLDPKEFVPAIGQGRLALTCRTSDMATRRVIETVDDSASHRLARMERILMQRLEGGCLVPIGCYGEEREGRVILYGYLGMPDGKREIRRTVEGRVTDAEKLAEDLAAQMLQGGGKEMLEELRPGVTK